MKVLLAVPPGRGEDELIVVPPLGLLYLAGALEQAGHSVEILDAFAERLNWDSFEARVKASKPDVIGIGGMTPVWDLSRKALKVLRSLAPIILAGGPHVTMRGPDILKDEPNIDYAVMGEGEETIVELIAALERGADPTGIPGVVSRKGEGPSRRPTMNLDDLPRPARHLLKTQLYRYPLLGAGAVATLFTSRGCPYGCIFCDKSVFGSRPRMHCAERVLSEIESIVCAEKVNSIIIYDDLFTLSRDRVIEICRGIVERGLKVRWKCEGRVDGVDPEMLEWMRRAGAKVLAYGIETISESGLKFLRKGIEADKIAYALRLTKDAGIDTLGYFLLGIPGERWDDAMETVRFACRYGVTWAQFSVLAPVPGTPLWGLAEEQGWYAEIDAKNPFDKDLRRPALLDGYWTEERLRGILRVAHRKFYLRPGYILRRIMDMGGVADLGRLARAGLRLMRWFADTKG